MCGYRIGTLADERAWRYADIDLIAAAPDLIAGLLAERDEYRRQLDTLRNAAAELERLDAWKREAAGGRSAHGRRYWECARCTGSLGRAEVHQLARRRPAARRRPRSACVTPSQHIRTAAAPTSGPNCETSHDRRSPPSRTPSSAPAADPSTPPCFTTTTTRAASCASPAAPPANTNATPSPAPSSHPAPGAAWAWCDHCGWRADHHPDDPPIGRAVTRIVNTTTNTKETTP
jgi:hypothetical protein